MGRKVPDSDYDREPRCIRGKEGRVSEKDDLVLLKTMLDKVTLCCRDRGFFVQHKTTPLSLNVNF